jgi:hypothetical protein
MRSGKYARMRRQASIDRRLFVKDVDGGAGEPVGFERQEHSLRINEVVARGVEQECPGFHAVERGGVD